MSERFRRGSISIGPGKCSGCDRVIHHGEVYLALDEKPSDKIKEEIAFVEEVECSECSKKLENGDNYLLVLEGEGEKCYCPACYKKKGGETFKKKNNGVPLTFLKSSEESGQLYFCRECCEKRKAGMEKKEKGEQVFTFFPVKALK